MYTCVSVTRLRKVVSTHEGSDYSVISVIVFLFIYTYISQNFLKKTLSPAYNLLCVVCIYIYVYMYYVIHYI